MGKKAKLEKLNKKTVIAEQVDFMNELLKLDTIPQDVKSKICTKIENLLMDHGMYGGFSYLNWINGGYELFAKENKEGSDMLSKEEKEKYLGKEYDRQYFIREKR